MADSTINRLLFDTFRRYPKPDLQWHKQGGRWATISTRTFLCRSASLAGSLEQMGIRPGDRVALFSENCPEWHVVDLACLALGGVTVPLYQAESLERMAYILRHSEARVCFVSGPEQLAKVQAAWEELPALTRVVLFTAAGARENDRVVALSAISQDEVDVEVLDSFERSARARQFDDVASLIYTSGTTGTPKGVLLTQGNFGSNVEACYGLWGLSTNELELCMLPLCHIFERTHAYVNLAHGGRIAYAESFDKVAENMREVRPTVIAAVPRFFEKFHARLQEEVRSAFYLKRLLFDWAVGTGRRALPYRLAGQRLPLGLAVGYRLADRLVYRKVRRALGGRVRHFISGGAPLARSLNEFFHALGLVIFEGYGLTETSPVVAVNYPGAAKLGAVGRPLAGVEVKIAPDGEILTRGPHIMKGYYKMEEETRRVLKPDGWFHTGDIGYVDEDGFLVVTDRKKDLIKTAGGKMIAPQPIENRLKASPYIQNAVVLGDRRKFVVALLVPDFPALERQGELRGIHFGSRAELLSHPEIHVLLEAEIEGVNRHLAQFERIKRFTLLEQEFSFAGGQLTYTQKVRRRQVEEAYRSLIDRLYEEEVPSTA